MTQISGPAGFLHIDDGGAGGVPVVFVHSFAGSTAHWAAQLTHLRKTRRAVALDMRSHGQSDSPARDEYAVESLAGDIFRYTKGQEPDKEGTIAHAFFTIEGQGFAAMDSAREHNFTFNEAISFIVNCKTQKEIDYYWDKLSAVPEAEQCGWLKDKYGLSWQIVPTAMGDMLKDKDKKKLARVTEAFLKMKKFDIAALKRAYKGV